MSECSSACFGAFASTRIVEGLDFFSMFMFFFLAILWKEIPTTNDRVIVHAHYLCVQLCISGY